MLLLLVLLLLLLWNGPLGSCPRAWLRYSCRSGPLAGREHVLDANFACVSSGPPFLQLLLEAHALKHLQLLILVVEANAICSRSALQETGDSAEVLCRGSIQFQHRHPGKNANNKDKMANDEMGVDAGCAGSDEQGTFLTQCCIDQYDNCAP